MKKLFLFASLVLLSASLAFAQAKDQIQVDASSNIGKGKPVIH